MPAMNPPSRLPTHAARYATSSGRPAAASSRSCVPMITSTIAYGIAKVKTPSCTGPVCSITPTFASVMPSSVHTTAELIFLIAS